MSQSGRRTAAGSSLPDRVSALDWRALPVELDTEGCAVVPSLLTHRECEEIASLYRHENIFRSRVVMARHGFGRGEYKYFSHPLPAAIEELRRAFYRRLVPVANRWAE